ESLREGRAGGYSPKTPFGSAVLSGTPVVGLSFRKEVDCERACSVPSREPLPGFSGGDLTRHRAAVLARGREPRGEGAARQADRGQGGGRPPPHLSRLSQGAHPDRRERAGRARATVSLLGKLIALLCLFGCDQGTQHDQETVGPYLHIVRTNVSPTQPLRAD